MGKSIKKIKERILISGEHYISKLNNIVDPTMLFNPFPPRSSPLTNKIV